MTDLEKELREFLVREKESADQYWPSDCCGGSYHDGMSSAFTRVIEWLDGDR